MKFKTKIKSENKEKQISKCLFVGDVELEILGLVGEEGNAFSDSKVLCTAILRFNLALPNEPSQPNCRFFTSSGLVKIICIPSHTAVYCTHFHSVQ